MQNRPDKTEKNQQTHLKNQQTPMQTIRPPRKTNSDSLY